MSISNVPNIFNRGSTSQIEEPTCSSYTGKMWTNYTSKINHMEPTSYGFLNTCVKIVAYTTTLPFMFISTLFTLTADTVKFSFNLTASALNALKNKFAKEEEETVQESGYSYAKIAALGFTGVSAIAASAYAAYRYFPVQS